MTRVKLFLGMISGCIVAAVFVLTASAGAQSSDANISLQVTPSPLVATLKPGVATELELKIRNASTAPETLKIEAKSFRFDDASGKVNLDDTTEPEVAPWLRFSHLSFTVQPGEWFTQKVTVDLPKETGFSYSFALLISRKDNPVATGADGRLLKGSVAVFTLINVDRPGATKRVELSGLDTDKKFYEFLPTTFNIRLKNTGNSIVQPYGNLFVQRGSTDQNAISTLPVNDVRAYLLPGTERTLSVSWSDGFPVYTSSNDAAGKPKTTLAWNIDKLSNFRFGQYTAKVVAVYSDGTRDVPITGEVSFWVIPWRALLAAVAVIVGLVLLMRLYIKKRTERAVKKALGTNQKG